ncbi:hypothetical protein AVEN_4826-1 [Araneus ventricosus]|uniref:Uncharacterized protein n=1 Tax=Araneus ventricosus TaxID=182803 RepID=A0A4Y2G8L7_ARAVE|nr:hypothetical protein AVEN_4826-1 [Araneus ventricosus]
MDEVLVSCPIDGEVWPRSFVAVSRYPAISFCFNAFFCGQLKKWALKAVFQKLFVDNEMWIVYLLSSDLRYINYLDRAQILFVLSGACILYVHNDESVKQEHRRLQNFCLKL